MQEDYPVLPTKTRSGVQTRSEKFFGKMVQRLNAFYIMLKSRSVKTPLYVSRYKMSQSTSYFSFGNYWVKAKLGTWNVSMVAVSRINL